jgi:hypothetical protein
MRRQSGKRISFTEQRLRDARNALKARRELLGPDRSSKLLEQAKALLDDNPKRQEATDAPDPSIWTDPLIWENEPWGERSCDMASWIEEQNIIDRAFADIGRKVLEGTKRGGRKNPTRDLKIWQEFQMRRAKSRKSHSALAEEIGSKHGLSRSAAIKAVHRGKKVSRLGRTRRR